MSFFYVKAITVYNKQKSSSHIYIIKIVLRAWNDQHLSHFCEKNLPILNISAHFHYK